MRNLFYRLYVKMFALPLLRIANWLHLMTFKRALQVDTLLLTKLKLLLRLLNADSRSEGYDDDYDKLIHIAAMKLRDPQVFESEEDYPEESPTQVTQTRVALVTEYAKQKEQIDSSTRNALESKDIKSTLADYCRIRHFIDTALNRHQLAEYYLSRAGKLGFSAKPIAESELHSYERSVRKDVAALRYALSDREALKIDLSVPGMAFLISIVSSLFLVSGYIYNRFLLDEFGVDVSLYFTLSDYISSSISRIEFSFSAAAIGVAAYFLGAHGTSRKSFAQVAHERSRPEYWRHFALAASVTGAVFNLYIGNIEIFYRAGYVAVTAASLFLLPGVCKKYFKQRDSALYAGIFILCLAAHLWSSLGITINELRTRNLSEMKVYDIAFKEPVAEKGNLLLVTANSGYFFFLDQERKMHIIGKSEVKSLVRMHKSKSPRAFTIFPVNSDTASTIGTRGSGPDG